MTKTDNILSHLTSNRIRTWNMSIQDHTHNPQCFPLNHNQSSMDYNGMGSLLFIDDVIAWYKYQDEFWGV